MCAVLAGPAFGVSGTWTNLAGGNWSDVNNWTNGTVADGSGNTASFSTMDPVADVAVHLDSARTIGTLSFGDTDTNTAAGWTVDNNGNPANVLTLTSAITVNALGAGKVATVSVVLAGTGGMSKSGEGVLVLSGTNTYSGVTQLNGVLEVTRLANGGAASSIGLSSGDAANLIFRDTSTLRYSGSGPTHGLTDRLFQLNYGGAVIFASQNPTLDASGAPGSPMVFSHTGRLVAPYTQNGNPRIFTLTGTNTDNNTLASVITQQRPNDRNTSVVKSGPGTWVLSGANVYDGYTTISGGVLKVTSLAPALPVTQSLVTSTESPVVAVASTAGLSPGMSIDMANGDSRGAIQAQKILSIDSPTQFTLENGTGVTAGTNNGNIGFAGALGWAAGTADKLILNGGTLQYIGSGSGSGTTYRAFTLGTGATAGTLDASGSPGSPFLLTNATAMAFSGSGTRTLTLSGTNTDANTLAGVVGNNGTNATSLNKSGPGRWVLTAVNTYSGSTTIDGGTLALGPAGTIGSSNITIAAGGVFDVTNKAGYVMAAGHLYTFGLFRSIGRIEAGTLDITGARVAVTGVPKSGGVFVMASYTNRVGASFASVTGILATAGWTIDYSHGGGTQIALIVPSAGTVIVIR